MSHKKDDGAHLILATPSKKVIITIRHSSLIGGTIRLAPITHPIPKIAQLKDFKNKASHFFKRKG